MTSDDELIIALLSRTRGGKEDATSRAELVKYLGDVRRQFPGLLEGMKPRTHREFRNARKKYDLVLAPGQVSTNLPIFLLSEPRIQNAARNFAQKLGLALYYKHAGVPLPRTGAVGARWYSNLQVETDAIPRELADVLPEFPKLARAREELTDQFFYRIGLTDTKSMGTFLAIFRQSFAIVGFVSVDASVFPPDTGPMTTRPVYNWDDRRVT